MELRMNEATDSPKVSEIGNKEISEETRREFDELMEDDDLPENLAFLGEGEYEVDEKTEKIRRLPRTGGEWSGEPGNSDWTPDSRVEPGDRNGTNPEHKAWRQIKEEYGFESIPFKDGEPDFSEVSKGKVEIDDFTDDREYNFAQADEKLAEQRGRTPEEVEKWREEHKYTWHECKDCKTMQKVPSEVHGNISHSGGVSEYKSQQQSA